MRAKSLGDRRLADAGVADQQRVVLLPPAQHLDGALDLGLAADQRVDAPVARLAIEIDAIGVERTFLLLALGAVLGLLRLARIAVFVDAARRARRIGEAGPLGDAVADVVDRVVAGHVLLLQEEGSVALALGEDRHQHVGAGHLLAARRLDVNRGALHDALEAGGRLRLVDRFDDQIVEIGVEILDDVLAQLVEIDVAGAQHRRGVRIVDQRQQQVFERRIFVAALVGERERLAKGLFERAGKYRHQTPFISFP